MPFYGPARFQIDGSPSGARDCMANVGHQLVLRHTVDRKVLTPRAIRLASGDNVGGLSCSQVADAVVRLTQNDSAGTVVLSVLRLDNRGQLRDLVASGRAVGIVINCRVTRYTTRRTGYFTGLHGVTAAIWRWTAPGQCDCELNQQTQHGEFFIEDPGTSAGWMWWSAGLVYRAAEAVGDIWTISSRDTEGVSRQAIAGVKIREKPSTTAPALGPIVIGRSYNVVETVRGGKWSRPGGTYGIGWHRIAAGGFIRGGALR